MTPSPKYVLSTFRVITSQTPFPLPPKHDCSTRRTLANNPKQLEEALGVSFAEKLLSLSDKDAQPGLLQAVGKAVGMLLEGLGVYEVNAFLDSATGGAVSSLTEILGIDDIEAALGIVPAPSASASA